MNSNIALELLLSQTHFVARGSIPQRILQLANWRVIHNLHWNYRISGCMWRSETVFSNALLHGNASAATLKAVGGGRSDFAMSQNRHPFGDVQTPRGDGQPSATFKRRAEISSHTEEMRSTTAPQGMQGKTFVAKIEERKEARKIFPEIAWRHAHQML